MASYYARVELHGASWPRDYEKLHDCLKRMGFTSCVPTPTRGQLRLPTGFYCAFNLVEDVDVVTEAVKTCAESSGYKYEIAVIKAADARVNLSSKC
jgi:hypothetical protein